MRDSTYANITVFAVLGPFVGTGFMLAMTGFTDWTFVGGLGVLLGFIPAVVAGGIFAFQLESHPNLRDRSLWKIAAMGATSGLSGAFVLAVAMFVFFVALGDDLGFRFLIGSVVFFGLPAVVAGAICALVGSRVAKYSASD